MLKRMLRNQQGGALALAIIMSFVVMAFAMTTIFIASSSNKQTFGEENKTQAFYIAKTGAESFIHHLEEMSKKGEDVKAELVKLKDEGLGKGEYDNGEFTLEIREIDTNKYEIESRGKINKVEDWIIAELTIDDIVGGGSNTGDGKIFINSSEQLVIETVPQLKGAGLQMYTNGKKTYEAESPIFLSDGKINELFISISDRKSKANGNTIEKLNNQKVKGYSLEIQETQNGSLNPNALIDKNNLIKRDKLVKHKGQEKDPDFHEIRFVYDTNKTDVLNYFTKSRLFDKDMADAEIKKGLESTFLLPLRSVSDYKDYISNKIIYPPSPSYNASSYNVVKENFIIDGKNEVTIPKDGNARFKEGIVLNNGGELVINTKGNADIKIDKKIETNTNNNITIKADGKVNIYLTAEAQVDGDILVEGNGEVNLYMYGDKFQTNNKSTIKNLNLYAPNSVVQVYEVDYQGIIVGKKVVLNDDKSIFRAPSSGPASTDDSKSKGISVEWRR